MRRRQTILITQKCQYALRAIFELSLQAGQGPIKIGQVAEAQAIPPRFLEVILSQLKQGGFVNSRRGNAGGYFLAKAPDQVTIGDVIRYVQGPIVPVDCLDGRSNSDCKFRGDCVFSGLWEDVRDAIRTVYERTTFQDLVDTARQRKANYVPSYTI